MVDVLDGVVANIHVLVNLNLTAVDVKAAVVAVFVARLYVQRVLEVRLLVLRAQREVELHRHLLSHDWLDHLVLPDVVPVNVLLW